MSKINPKTILTTQWKQKIIPYIINFLEGTIGVPYDFIVNCITKEINCQPIDIQLQLCELTREGIVNVESGLYYVNHTSDTEEFIQECLKMEE